MAGQWDQLPMDQKRAIANIALQGQKKSPENMNRIMQQLSENPSLVAQFATDAGVDIGVDAERQSGEEASDSARIDRYVDKSLDQTGSNDVPGEIQKTGNGQLEDRVRMLEQALHGSAPASPASVALQGVNDPGGEWWTDIMGSEGRPPMDNPEYQMRREMAANQQGRVIRGPTKESARRRFPQ